MSLLSLKLKPGDVVKVDRHTILTCTRSRAGQLALEIEAPNTVLLQHIKADRDPKSTPGHNPER